MITNIIIDFIFHKENLAIANLAQQVDLVALILATLNFLLH